MDVMFVTLASLLAGFIDSIVGGGGLILVPALFAAYPGAHAATLLGTNKSASVWGTLFAAAQYSRRVTLPWPTLWPALLMSGLGALIGAWLLTLASPQLLRLLLPFILLALLAYTLARKELGRTHAPRFSGRQEMAATALIGLVLGTYDGFFGPGAGSFYVFVLVRWLGYDFLHATACTKLLNLCSNAVALGLLAFKGHVWWHIALGLALANIAGSLLGTHMALKHGAGFVRLAFIGVVSALIVKTGWDALHFGIRP